MIIGIVGKPSAGKSTFFKAATMAEVAIANFPFTTIKANEGIGFVRTDCVEKFFKVKCNPRQGECIQGNRFIPVKLIDVAGLVPGAHEGKGMGNQFLDDLRQADVLIHIVDASGSINEKGEPVQQGSYDPLNDVRFLEDELNYWFSGMMKKVWQKFSKQAISEGKDFAISIANQFSGLNINLETVKKTLSETNLTGKRLDEWTEQELFQFASKLREKGKPIIIAANKLDLPTARENIERLKEQFPNYKIIPCSAESELALKEAAKKNLINYIPGDPNFTIENQEKLDEKQTKALEFIKKLLNDWKSTGVQTCLDTAVFDILNYIVIFPGGVNKLSDSEGRVLPDAFLLPPKSTALDFAYKLHSDFGDNFIRAIDVKTKKTIGKDHVLKNGDVIEIISKS